MGKIKRWFFGKFLPEWCKETLIGENDVLRDELTCARQEVERLHAYIDGMHVALRRCGRISINTGEGRT